MADNEEIEEVEQAQSSESELVPEDAPFLGSCMLVSDSNEVSTQLDSKKLDYQILADLAQDSLLTNYLDMSKYLPSSLFTLYKGILDDEYETQKDLKSSLSIEAKPRLKAVEGQVILVDAASVDQDGASPEDIIREKWYLPAAEFQLVPIPDCMLRGITGQQQEEEGQNVAKIVPSLLGNERVRLTNANLPAHRHHDAVTTGSGMYTMAGDPEPGKETYALVSAYAHDVFYSDELVGLDKNEMDGIIDEFDVQDSFQADVYHDNLPKCRSFYGFVVRKPTA